MNSSTSKHFLGILSGLSIIAWACGSLHAARSVTHYGVTVHFAGDHQIGQFANGEPWIVGPVSVTGIDKPNFPEGSPGPVGGAMINPLPGDRKQGFCPRDTWDTTAHIYDPALDVSLSYPFSLAVEDSLIVARAIGSGHENDGGAYVAYIDSMVGFTVLDKAPPSGSFRPGLYGTDRTIRFNKSDIDYGILKNLEPVPGTPTQTWMEASYRCPALPWWEWTKEWTGSFIRPLENCGTGNGAGYRSQYGREVAVKWSETALWLNTKNTNEVKEKVMIQTIQSGLDLISYLKNGGRLVASGGHQVGRKFPILLAAAALKDPALLAFASDPTLVVEDLCTFYVGQNDIGRPVEGGKAAMYTPEDLGIPEWGIDHSWNPWKDDRRWEDGGPYRFVQWPAMTGQLLAAELMGLKEAWGHPPIFDYNMRFIEKRGLGEGYVAQMWDKYMVNPERPSITQGLRRTR